MRDLHELPRFSDSWSFLYLEHCKIEQEDQAIAFFDTEGKTPVPCATLTVLMLGPGTNITHAAIKTLADNGCSVLWCGDGGVRFYAQGLGESRSAVNLLKQAKLCTNPELRLKVVRRLYNMRFPEPLPDDMTLQQIRGREGSRVRTAYSRASKETGVPWQGRNYDRGNWDRSDPVNRALSSANACLYGICHAAILSSGYSPGLGFIHTGKQLSFVYDIGDLYKVETTIPAAFQAAAAGVPNIERHIRLLCRKIFEEKRILSRIVEDIYHALDVLPDDEMVVDYDSDQARPGYLWDDEDKLAEGGMNYGMMGDGEPNGGDDS
jgi:CRISPR-associated protein Cas1